MKTAASPRRGRREVDFAVNLDELRNHVRIAARIEAALCLVLPSSPLASVVVEALAPRYDTPSAPVFRVLCHVGKAVRGGDDRHAVEEQYHWWHLKPGEGDRYAAWLEAGNAGWPDAWRVLESEVGASFVDRSAGGVFGQASGAP